VTPDNLLTVVGGHVSSEGGVRTGTQNFSWSARTGSFGPGTADLVSYINFGNNSVWGWIEVTLTDNHVGVQTTGKYTKRYQIGRNIDTAVGHQSFEVPANIGSVVDQWNLGDFEVDGSDNLVIPIHRITTLTNSVSVFVEGQLHVASLDTVDNVLNSLALSTPGVVTNSATRDYYSIMSDRVGIGTTDPTYTLEVAGNVGFDEYLYHNDDPDTFIRLQANALDINCGNVKLISYYETGNDAVHVNPQNGDVNFQVDASGGVEADYAFFVDAGLNKVSIGTANPQTRLTVAGAITLVEQAAADASVATYGQIWVNTATPNELYFTTDAGDDIPITSGTAVASVTSLDLASDSGSTSAITTSGTLTIAGTANEIETSATGTTVTVGLPSNVVIAGDLKVSGNDITDSGAGNIIGSDGSGNIDIAAAAKSTTISGPTIHGEGIRQAFTEISVLGATALDTTNTWINANAASNAVNLTLPSAAGVGPGFLLYVHDFNGTGATNDIVISRTGSDTIGGAVSKTISMANGHLQVISNGVNAWGVVSELLS
jgi:hypothetical protein